MLGIKVPKKEAETFRRKHYDIILKEYTPLKNEEYVIFPVSRGVEGYEVVEAEFEKRKQKPTSVKEALRGRIPDEKIGEVVRSFDIIGDVALVRIPENLWEYREAIGKAVAEVHRNIRTVAVKRGKHEGEYRVQEVEVVYGDKNLETCYKEHGVKIWLEVGKTYFSPRLSFERKRIAEQVKPGETVAVFFAGVGPFALVIAKKQPAVRKIYAIEINPNAYKYLERNVKENGFEGKIFPILGDVREEVPIYCCGVADRVVMPLPKDAHHFLDTALLALGDTGYIHFYHFAPENDLYTEAISLIKKAAKEFGKEAEILGYRKVRPYAPRVYQIVLDVKVF